MTIRLSTEQRAVVDHDEGALLVVAGPGSGKTRVLTERVRRLLAQEQQHFRILAVTFTNKAANEMVERLSDVPQVGERAFVGTLHSFCTEVLANRGKSVGITQLPNIFENFQDRKQLLMEAVENFPDLRAELRAAGDAKSQSKRLDDWLAALSDAKNALQIPDTMQDAKLAALYREYDASLRACNAVDFDDLLLLTYRLFEERPKVAEFYRRQYRYICVDEAQDLNEAQYRVLESLCGAEYRNVMMVGDPKQAIFTWNGASPKYMDIFERRFEADKIELTQNFRSSRAVVAAAKALDSKYSVDGQLPIEGDLSIEQAADEQAEAELVCSRIEELLKDGHPDVEGGVQAENIAVLGRNRFVFKAIEEELRSRGIPYYKKISAANVQSESDVLQEFELALRVIANPRDRLHLGALAAAWGKGGFDEHQLNDDASGVELLQRLADSDCPPNATLVIGAVAESTPEASFRLSRGLEALESAATSLPDDQRALVLEDIALWRKHWDFFVRSEAPSSHSPSVFLTQMALGTTQQPREDGVALLTVHSAKGMEFDVVFIVGMVEGVFPDYRAQGSALQEEGRNAFVAVTRSRRLLRITYPAIRLMPWGDNRRQVVSRYVPLLQASVQA